MGKLKAKRKFAGENFLFVGSRSTKKKAKVFANQGRDQGFKSRVVKATPAAKKQGSNNYQVWGSVKKKKKRKKKRKR